MFCKRSGGDRSGEVLWGINTLSLDEDYATDTKRKWSEDYTAVPWQQGSRLLHSTFPLPAPDLNMNTYSIGDPTGLRLCSASLWT
jgi:hypothetical protein